MDRSDGNYEGRLDYRDPNGKRRRNEASRIDNNPFRFEMI
jgi:hypothetical protein